MTFQIQVYFYLAKQLQKLSKQNWIFYGLHWILYFFLKLQKPLKFILF